MCAAGKVVDCATIIEAFASRLAVTGEDGSELHQPDSTPQLDGVQSSPHITTVNAHALQTRRTQRVIASRMMRMTGGASAIGVRCN